jgi:transcriptional regulator with XRE-family HTH domain
MANEGTRRLADALIELLRTRPVTIQHIVTTVGVARNTITALRRQRIHHPDPELLRRIAQGFATDSVTGEVDEHEMNTIHGVLNAAIGYADPIGQQTETLIELGLYHQYKSLPRARAWLDLFQAGDDLPLPEIRALADQARRRAEQLRQEP